jgi:hypothetical protein
MYICKKDGKDSKEKSKEEKKDSGEGRQRREARRDACHRATTPSSAKESTMRRRRWQEWATSRRLLLPDPVTHVRRAKGVRAAEERLGTRSRTRTGHLLLTAYQPADSHRPSLRVSPAGCVRARPCEETRGYYGTDTIEHFYQRRPRLGHEANFLHPSQAHARSDPPRGGRESVIVNLP